MPGTGWRIFSCIQPAYHYERRVDTPLGPFTVYAAPTGTLKIYSKDQNGTTVSGKKLILYDSNWNAVGVSVTTNSSGYYQWNNLDAGTYNVGHTMSSFTIQTMIFGAMEARQFQPDPQ